MNVLFFMYIYIGIVNFCGYVEIRVMMKGHGKIIRHRYVCMCICMYVCVCGHTKMIQSKEISLK